MAFDNEVINLQTKKVLGVSEFAVNSSFNIDLEKPLKKVLNVSALADVVSAESIDTDYNFSGKAQISILYLSENNTIESITGVADWQNSTKVSGENLQTSISVIETSVESSSATEVSVSVLLNAIIEGNTTQQIMPVAGLTDDYVTNKENVSFTKIVASGSDKFTIADSAELAIVATEVLNNNAYVVIKNVFAGIDQVTVEGYVDLKTLYSTEGGFNTYTKQIEFKQEIACMGALPGQEAEAKVNLSNLTVNIEVAEKTTFIVAIGMQAYVTCYNVENFEVTTDLFSTAKQTDLEIECVGYANYSGCKYITDTAVCTAAIEIDGMDEIISAINPVLSIAKATTDGGKLVVEGVLSANIIYRNNGTETISNYTVNCPFANHIDIEQEGNVNCANSIANISSIKLRSGKEVEIVFDLSLTCSINKDDYFEYVKNVTETGDRAENQSAITIYVAKQNQSIFEVARVLGVSPDVITSQNNIETDRFVDNQRIFVYNPLNAEF